MLIGYARVSTADQSLEAQIDALKIEGCKKIYSEKATGSRRSQKQLKEMLNHLREGETVMVVKIDRLGRNMRELLDTVEEIKQSGADFKSLGEGVDTRTAAGKMFFQMACIFADFERAQTRERTKAGLEAAKKRGRIGGRPRALTSEQIAAVRKLQAENEPTAKIARIFKVSRATIKRVAV